MSSLEVTVVVVARNAASILPTCLLHLEQQSLPAAHYEILVADAASSDNTLEVVASCASGAPVRIRPVRSTSPEIIKALNAGLHAAEGRYVLVLTPDLLASPELLERHLEVQKTAGLCLGLGPVLRHPQMSSGSPTHWSSSIHPDAGHPAEAVNYLQARASNFSLPRNRLIWEGGLDARFLEPDIAAAELAFRIVRGGMPIVPVPGGTAYAWLPADLAAERDRAYRLGYSLHRLAELTDAGAVWARYPKQAPWTRPLLDWFIVPFYLRRLLEDSAGTRVWRQAYRRLLRSDQHAGLVDALRERPPRGPAGA